MKKLSQQFKFFLIIFLELLFFPFLYFWEWFKNEISNKNASQVKKIRSGIDSKMIYINIHEWGGYPSTRIKKIKTGKEFACGLQAHLERFSKVSKKIQSEIYLTISEISLFKNKIEIEKSVDKIVSVSNEGMDFSGYSEFYNLVKDKPNAYVLLCNTSVNVIQTEFLENYISYMEANPDVGMMGVSYCSKIWQSIIRNNFTPHLQSFFLLTTIEVLNEIVAKNGGKFPGKGIVYKRLLIRDGEIKISKLVQKLGYNLAVTLEDKSVFKFGKNNYFDNGFKRWILKHGDIRLTCDNPNIINEIGK
ncbi:hypothetical protein NLG42_01540 [Flavobacterium plurextorum]|uniref:hypothetical protein n=1 Tax=Flavobacterium TaxID=237 RepID=UPI00214DBF6F|nr:MULTISPECIES: hypothetical protein [Flavobacterium]UUW09494.1 hypothetical protein NLG42_01540 [Flavobacterium plurextorum]